MGEGVQAALHDNGAGLEAMGDHLEHLAEDLQEAAIRTALFFFKRTYLVIHLLLLFSPQEEKT